MKKYNNKQDTGGYGGCVLAGLQLTFIISMIVVICVVLFSCRTSEPCGTYSKWEAKTKFRSK